LGGSLNSRGKLWLAVALTAFSLSAETIRLEDYRGKLLIGGELELGPQEMALLLRHMEPVVIDPRKIPKDLLQAYLDETEAVEALISRELPPELSHLRDELFAGLNLNLSIARAEAVNVPTAQNSTRILGRDGKEMPTGIVTGTERELPRGAPDSRNFQSGGGGLLLPDSIQVNAEPKSVILPRNWDVETIKAQRDWEMLRTRWRELSEETRRALVQPEKISAWGKALMIIRGLAPLPALRSRDSVAFGELDPELHDALEEMEILVPKENPTVEIRIKKEKPLWDPIRYLKAIRIVAARTGLTTELENPEKHNSPYHLHLSLGLKDLTELAASLNDLLLMRILDAKKSIPLGPEANSMVKYFADIDKKGLVELVSQNRLQIRAHLNNPEEELKEIIGLIRDPQAVRRMNEEIQSRLPKNIERMTELDPEVLVHVVRRSARLAGEKARVTLDSPSIARVLAANQAMQEMLGYVGGSLWKYFAPKAGQTRTRRDIVLDLLRWEDGIEHEVFHQLIDERDPEITSALAQLAKRRQAANKISSALIRALVRVSARNPEAVDTLVSVLNDRLTAANHHSVATLEYLDEGEVGNLIQIRNQSEPVRNALDHMVVRALFNRDAAVSAVNILRRIDGVNNKNLFLELVTSFGEGRPENHYARNKVAEIKVSGPEARAARAAALLADPFLDSSYEGKYLAELKDQPAIAEKALERVGHFLLSPNHVTRKHGMHLLEMGVKEGLPVPDSVIEQAFVALERFPLSSESLSELIFKRLVRGNISDYLLERVAHHLPELPEMFYRPAMMAALAKIAKQRSFTEGALVSLAPLLDPIHPSVDLTQDRLLEMIEDLAGRQRIPEAITQRLESRLAVSDNRTFRNAVRAVPWPGRIPSNLTLAMDTARKASGLTDAHISAYAAIAAYQGTDENNLLRLVTLSRLSTVDDRGEWRTKLGESPLLKDRILHIYGRAGMDPPDQLSVYDVASELLGPCLTNLAREAPVGFH
jgi:hypothetical protein